MLGNIKSFIGSKQFLRFAVILFAAQGVLLSLVVPYKAPSDEEYHFRFTQHYAHRSWLAGPVIADQTDNFDLGDIQRAPGYLYHYLSSFLLRSIQPVISSEWAQVVVLRLVNVGLGVAALLLIIALLRRINSRGVVVNLVVAWLAVTTMFVWLFAGLNYDNLAIVLFLGLLYGAFSTYQKLTVTKLLGLVSVSFALMLTKETFLPPIFITFVLLLVGLLRAHSIKALWRQLIDSMRRVVKLPRGRAVLILLSALVVLMAGLFTERYVQNYVRYQRTTPACNKVHSEDECMQHGIYRRNTGQRKEYVEYLQNGGQPTMNFAEFSRTWVRAVYERTYGYRGMNTVIPSIPAKIISVLTAVVLLSFAIMGWRRHRYSTIEKGLLIITVAYSVLVFLYNYNIYRYYGYPFAIQGRYLLPVLPFMYYFIATGWLAAYGQLGRGTKNKAVMAFTTLLVLNLLVQSPVALYVQQGHLLRKQTSINRQIG